MPKQGKLLFNLNLFILLFSGLFIRFILIPQPGFEADIAYWKWWADEASKIGAPAMINNTGINYPPFFAYILELMGKLYYGLGGVKENLFDVYNLLFLFLSKAPSILSDVGTAYLIYKIVQEFILVNFEERIKNKLSLITSALYLFNPVVIFDGAYWGQTDGIAAFLTLLYFYLCMKKRVWLAFAIATIALFTKVQTFIFIPILILITFKGYGIKKVVEGMGITAATFYIINFPYIYAKIMPRIFSLIVDSASYFPLASLNAYNFWWIIVDAKGFTTPDTILIANIISYKTLGLALFGLTYIITCLYLWISSDLSNFKKLPFSSPNKEDDNKIAGSPSDFTRLPFFSANDKEYSQRVDSEKKWKTEENLDGRPKQCIKNTSIKNYFPIFLACAFISFAFYMLPTEIHERYIYPIFMFLTLLFPYLYKSKFFIIHCLFYLLLSLSIFLNLHLVLVLNYPDNGMPLISLLNKAPVYEPFTLLLSWINVVLFLLLSFCVLKTFSKSFWIKGAIGGVILISVLFGKNMLTNQKNEVYLSDLKPINIYQDYGKLEKNRSVDKNNLSSSYYYFNKGLGSHANSLIVYNLNKNWKRFVTDFGVDTESGEAASVEFFIRLDGKDLVKSPVMKKWSKPGHFDIDVTNVKTLELGITDAKDGRNGDHADWLQPKLYR